MDPNQDKTAATLPNQIFTNDYRKLLKIDLGTLLLRWGMFTIMKSSFIRILENSRLKKIIFCSIYPSRLKVNERDPLQRSDVELINTMGGHNESENILIISES